MNTNHASKYYMLMCRTSLLLLAFVLHQTVAAKAAPGADNGTRLSGSRALVENISAVRTGDQFRLSMDVCLDSVRVRHGEAVAFKPMARSVDGTHQVEFQPLLITGRDQHVMYQRNRNNLPYPTAREVKREKDEAQTVTYAAQVPYEDWMRKYNIAVAEDLCGCGDIDGGDPTTLLTYSPHPTMPQELILQPSPDDYKKIRFVQGRAYIDFPVNRTEMHPNYRRNPEELRKIIATIDEVKGKADVEIQQVTIHGYASPEGSYQNNVRLAEGRAATLMAYIQNLYRFAPGVISSTSTPEDWAGLREYVANHATAEQHELLEIIDSSMEPDTKDQTMKRRFPERYAQLLADVYPALRHSDYLVNYTIRPYTLEESREVYRTHPADLSVGELYALASEAGLNTPQGRAILEKGVSLYPDNERLRLMAAQAAFQANDLSRAETLLGTQTTSPQGAYLLGSIRKMQERYDEALALMQRAAEGGVVQAKQQIEEIKELK